MNKKLKWDCYTGWLGAGGGGMRHFEIIGTGRSKLVIELALIQCMFEAQL